MAAREPGKFRRKLFGGFNRKDVLAYIQSLYGEIDRANENSEALRQRNIELENLIQNLQRGGIAMPAQGIAPAPTAGVAPAAPEYPPMMQTPMTNPTPSPLYDPELMSALASEPAPAPVSELPPEAIYAPMQTPAVAPTPPPAKPTLATPPGASPQKVKVIRRR